MRTVTPSLSRSMDQNLPSEFMAALVMQYCGVPLAWKRSAQEMAPTVEDLSRIHPSLISFVFKVFFSVLFPFALFPRWGVYQSTDYRPVFVEAAKGRERVGRKGGGIWTLTP